MEMLAGTLEIQSGQVIFHPPKEDQRPPIVSPGPQVEVRVDGEIVTGPTPVRAGQTVEVIPLREEPETIYEAEIAEDGLSAYLSIRRREGKVYELADAPPTPELRPVARLKETLQPPDPTVDEVKAFLKEEGIVYGINDSVIEQLISGALQGTQKVAAGEPMVPGVDGRVEFRHPSLSQLPLIDEKTDRVDYLARPEVAFVNPGDVIAIIHPSVPGVEGRSVTGEALIPPAPEDVRVRVGDGAELSPDGTQVLAARAGRPMRRDDQFFVAPAYIHQGDVDIQTGNISFQGDVVVEGNVEERLRVEATGRVGVRGHVIRATIFAQGNIRVAGQMVGAKLLAGGYASIHRELFEKLNEIGRELRLLEQASQQLKQSFVERGMNVPAEGHMIATLVQKKFSHLPERVARVSDLFQSIDFPFEVDLGPVVQSLKRFVRPPHQTGRGLETSTLAPLIRQVSDVCQDMAAIAYEPAHVISEYAQQSEIHASGDVHIQGLGAYHSTVRAEGIVVVTGVFRGGIIRAGEGVYVGELGSAAEVKTVVHLGEEGYARVRRIYPGVWVQTDRSVWRSQTLLEDIEVQAVSGGLDTRSLSQWQPPKLPTW